jgi:hypothetical protein
VARSRVELFEQIRRDRRDERLSMRELADRHHVHRRTVRQALASAIPPPRKSYPRRSRPAIDPYAEVIDGWLFADRDVPRKAFAAELPALLPLPAEEFDPARLLEARVDNRARVAVRQCYYSVPARYADRRLAVRLSATTVEVLDAGKAVARHERAAGRYVEVLILDTTLEVLKINRARCLAQLRWRRRRPAARSLRHTRPTGTPPARRAVTPPARGR